MSKARHRRFPGEPGRWPEHGGALPILPMSSTVLPVAFLDGGASSSWLALVHLEVGELQEAESGGGVVWRREGCRPARIPARQSGEATPDSQGPPGR